MQRAKNLVKDYRIVNSPSSQPGNTDPPPPYSLTPYYSNPPYNPDYLSPDEESNATPSRNNNARSLYPEIRHDEELASAVSAAHI